MVFMNKIPVVNKPYWKRARRLVSSLFFVLTCLSAGFVLPKNWSQNVLSFQLGPEIIRILSGFAVMSVLGMAIIMTIVVVFGRIYCSTLCPLGFLQDISIWMGKLLSIKSKYEISNKKNLKLVRIGILVVTIVLLIFGNTFVIGFIEPFTIFSRFLYFLKMLFNGLISLSFWPVLIILASILLVFIPALKIGRFFCSWICPVGTVLWGFSRLNIFQLKINPSECNNCNTCITNCKTGAISSQTKRIDQALCIGCFNCSSVCSRNAIKIGSIKKEDSKAIVSKKDGNLNAIVKSRRKFLSQFGSAVFIMAIPINLDFIHTLKDHKTKKNQIFPVFPLGAKNLKRFMQKCTGCMLCALKCPSQIIHPSLGSTNSSPILPVLNFHKSYCLEDCVECSKVCPTEALEEVLVAEKKTTKMAFLELNLANCRIVVDGLECSICAEICPLNAIKMKILPLNKSPLPTVIQELCIGCGKCLYRCPVKGKDDIFRFTYNWASDN